MILDNIRAWLAAEGVSFREVHHEPTRTSEESARARGEELRVGGKALLIKVDDVYRLFVLSADRKLDSAAVKRHFGARKTRFATPRRACGPSQGGWYRARCLRSANRYSHFPCTWTRPVLSNERIAFNVAGSLTDSSRNAGERLPAACRTGHLPAHFADLSRLRQHANRRADHGRNRSAARESDLIPSRAAKLPRRASTGSPGR